MRDLSPPRAVPTEPLQALLVGGYFGTWVTRRGGDAPAPGPRGPALGWLRAGFGRDHRPGRAACGLHESARGDRLPGRPVRGPVWPVRCTACAPLPTPWRRWPAAAPRAAISIRVLRWCDEIKGRGACHHPDGAVRFVQSALSVFGDEIQRHRRRALHQPAGRTAAGRRARRPDDNEEDHMSTSLRLRVNPIACEAHGLCAELLPELIRLDDWGYPIIDAPDVPAELEGLARRAVDACPTLALILERVEDPAGSADPSDPRWVTPEAQRFFGPVLAKRHVISYPARRRRRSDVSHDPLPRHPLPHQNAARAQTSPAPLLPRGIRVRPSPEGICAETARDIPGVRRRPSGSPFLLPGDRRNTMLHSHSLIDCQLTPARGAGNSPVS